MRIKQQKYISNHDIVAGITIFILTTTILLITSSTTISWWSSPLYAQNVHFLGIPYQGESILYILAGRVFSVLFYFLSSEKALVLFSILCASTASIFFYFGIRDLLDNFQNGKHTAVSRLAALSISISIPFMYSVWNYAIIIDCYILGVLLFSVLFWLSTRIWLTSNMSERCRLFLLICFVIGLDYASHRLNQPYIIVGILLLAFPLRSFLTRPAFYGHAIFFFVLGCSLHFYLLFRGSYNTEINMNTVRTFSELLSWIRMDNNPDSNLAILFNRRAPLWSYQIDHMYLRYLKWNIVGYRMSLLSCIPLVFTIAGLVWTILRKFKVALVILYVWFSYSILLALYLNIWNNFFREIDRLFLPSFPVFYLWTAIGLWLFLSKLKSVLYHFRIRHRPIFIIVLSAILLLLPLSQITMNWRFCNKRFYTFPYEFAQNMLYGCQENSILLTGGDNDTFPLLYAQGVHKIRPDISIVNVYMLQSYIGIKELCRYNPSLCNILPEKEVEFDSLINELSLQDGSIPIRKWLTQKIIRSEWSERPVYLSKYVKSEVILDSEFQLFDTGLALWCCGKEETRDNEIEILRKNLLCTYRYVNIANRQIITADDNITQQYFIYLKESFIKLTRLCLSEGNVALAFSVIEEMEEYLPSWRFTEELNRETVELRKRIEKAIFENENERECTEVSPL